MMDKLNYEGIKLTSREKRLFFSGIGLGIIIGIDIILLAFIIGI